MTTKDSTPDHDRQRPFRPNGFYFAAVVSSWLVPGCGHLMMGHPVRGIVLAATLLGTFWYGESVLAGNMAVTREIHPVFFALQAGNGASALVANELWGEPRHPPDQLREIKKDLPKYLNLGILFTSVAGLLNLLVVLHVMDPRSWHESQPVEHGKAPSPGGPRDPAGERENRR